MTRLLAGAAAALSIALPLLAHADDTTPPGAPFARETVVGSARDEAGAMGASDEEVVDEHADGASTLGSAPAASSDEPTSASSSQDIDERREDIAPGEDIAPSSEDLAGAPIDEGPAASDETDETDRLGPLEVEVGVGISFAWIGTGLPADTSRPAFAPVDGPWTSCDARGDACSVRVASSGFANALTLRASAALHLDDTLAVLLALRMQPDSGAGFLSSLIVEAGLAARMIRGSALSFDGLVLAGLGQIQAQPRQADSDIAPYTTSGPASAALGGRLAIHVDAQVELRAQLLARATFPTFVWALEPSVTLAIRTPD